MKIIRPLQAALWLLLSLPFACHQLAAQAISTSTNALDRINFGDTTSDATSESTHAFVSQGNPTGVGALGLTYRKIAPSSVSVNVGTPADNETLTFTMACDPTLQNYLTIQVWGSDTTFDVIYLYTASQGYQISNYYGTNEPEIDFQEADPMLPGRFVYETIPIPLALTQGKTTVTLVLNAANSYGYYSGGTTDLAAGQTSRPIYAAFTHTAPYLILNTSDPQGIAPSTVTPTAPTYNTAYLNSIITTMSVDIQSVLNNQVFGSSWSTAVSAGKVPAQIYGYFDSGKSASNAYTTAQWLNNAAIDTSSANNVAMERLDELAVAYTTPGFLTTFYQNATVEQAIVAALDAYSYMQALNGCWGDMVAWDGIGSAAVSGSNPYGRTNAQCSPIEGAGTYALGSAIVLLQNDSAFMASLNQPISATLEPGVQRYKAYQTMLTNNLAFLNSSIGPGHAPNQDLLQARSYIYSNLALQALDKLYGTSMALTNAAMMQYVNVAAGLAPEQYGGIWISPGGLGLELNGTGNGSYDGGYGFNDMNDLVTVAKILADAGIETANSHPIRTVALNAVHAFSNFIYPSLAVSGTGYAPVYRTEENITFRKNLNIGEVQAGANYYAATQFSDPYALHAFYLEVANGAIWTIPSFNAGGFDDTLESYMREFSAYSQLCAQATSQSDASGITFLNEAAHPDGVWADPQGSTIVIKHNGEKLDMVLNWRPLQVPGQDNKPSVANEIVNNLARVHDTTATTDRVATVFMPSSTATGASGSYKSGAYGTLYVGRYGNYLVGLNWQTTATTMALPPDMIVGTATDLMSGVNYDLTNTTAVPVPAGGAIALFQSLPTAVLSPVSVSFAPTPVSSTSATQSITLKNGGTGPLVIASATLSGSNAGDFAVATTCSSSLAANLSCSYSITFTPQAAGPRSAVLSVKTSTGATAQSIPLTGTGTSPVVPTLSMSASPNAISMVAGSTSMSVLTLTPGTAFSGTVALVCASPQSFITCTLPSTVAVGSSVATATISISVAATTSQVIRSAPSQLAFAFGSGLSCLLLLLRRRTRSIFVFAVLLMISFASLTLAGCGGSSSDGAASRLPPAGSYTLTITGMSASLSQPTATTVVVNLTN